MCKAVVSIPLDMGVVSVVVSGVVKGVVSGVVEDVVSGVVEDVVSGCLTVLDYTVYRGVLVNSVLDGKMYYELLN